MSTNITAPSLFSLLSEDLRVATKELETAKEALNNARSRFVYSLDPQAVQLLAASDHYEEAANNYNKILRLNQAARELVDRGYIKIDDR